MWSCMRSTAVACLQMPQLTLGLSQLLPQHQHHLAPNRKWTPQHAIFAKRRDFRARPGSNGGRHFRKKLFRAHPGSNWGPIDLQSIALPLSYTPATMDTKAVGPFIFRVGLPRHTTALVTWQRSENALEKLRPHRVRCLQAPARACIAFVHSLEARHAPRRDDAAGGHRHCRRPGGGAR